MTGPAVPAGETRDRPAAAPAQPSEPEPDLPATGPSLQLADLIVEDGVVPGPAQEGRTAFLDRLTVQLESMVDEEMDGTPWRGRDCPWITRSVAAFRVRPLDELRRTAARYGSAAGAGSGVAGLRAAIVERARAGVRQWRATGRAPRLPPGVSGPAADLAGAAGLLRKADGSGRAPATTSPAAVRGGLGAGRPLDPGDRTWLERSFRHDLSAVRLHDDPAGHSAAADQAARAFALGDDIVLGASAGSASPLARRMLLAHEAAHVVQQRGGGATDAAGLERDADLAAARAVLDRSAAAPARGAGLALRSCGTPDAVSEQDIAQYLATHHLRIVVTQETVAFVSGQKKSVAVAANAKADVTQIVKRDDDELIIAENRFPRLLGVVLDSPASDGSRFTRPSAMHAPTGTFTVTLMFPGHYEITADVLLAPGHPVRLQHGLDVAKADFVGESALAAVQEVAGQEASTPTAERLGLTLQQAGLRQKAAETGLLPTAVTDAWTALSLAVVDRAAALQKGGAGPGTSTVLDDALRAFEAAFGGVPPSLDVPIKVLRSRAFGTDLGRLRSAAELLSRAFDTWVLQQVKGKPGGEELAKGIEYSSKVDAEVAGIEQRAARSVGPLRLPAVFHPEAAYARHEALVSGPTNLGKIVSMPLNLWLFKVDGDNWRLRDITNPEETFEYRASGTDRDVVIDELLKKIAEDEEHWPNGQLHVQRPGRSMASFTTDSRMDFMDWLKIAGLVLTAAGLILVTAGAATPGVVAAAGGYLLTASAVVGAAIAVADTVDAYQRGRLTEKRLALNALQLIASVASAGTSTIFANAALRGTSGLARLGGNARYLFLNRVATGADVVNLLVMTGDTAVSLAKMSFTGKDGEQNAARAALALGQLLVQGTVTIVAAHDTFRGGDLTGNPAMALHEGADGSIVVRELGASAANPKAPRTPENLLDAAGTHFAADHAPLRAGYDAYRARCKARGEEPLHPLEWLKFQSRGKPAEYLEQTMPQGWRAAWRGEYPGARPHLIDRPSNSPREGSAVGDTTQRWRYTRVPNEDIRPEVDNAGDLWWTFPDLHDGEVLLLPSGTRVWKNPKTRGIVTEHPVGASVSGQRSRTQGEATRMSRADIGPAHEAAKTERAHSAASPGLGYDSPYDIASAPRRINQELERAGIEMYVGKLRDNAEPGVYYLFTTETQVRAPADTLSERVYRIDAVHGGEIHPMFEFKVVLEGGVADANARFVQDEMSVFPGAEVYGSPKTAKGVGVEIPKVLKEAMTSPVRAPAAGAAPPRGFEASQGLRGRFDDLMEGRIKLGVLDSTWLDAQAEAVQALQDAERRVFGGTDAARQQQLRDLVTDMTRRAGRFPATIDTKRLKEFTEALKALR